MPVCEECKKVKKAAEFPTYITKSGVEAIRNPCLECEGKRRKHYRRQRQATAKGAPA